MFKFLLICVSLASAFRSRIHQHDFGQDPTPSDLIDVTDLIQDFDASGAVKCCCDDNDRWITGGRQRSGRCALSYNANCEEFGRDFFDWQTGRMIHFLNSGNGCRMPGNVVTLVAQDLLRRYPVADYCKSLPLIQTSERGTASVPAAAFEATSPVACGIGLTASSANATCSYATPTTGIFVPQPECATVENYCGAIVSARGDSDDTSSTDFTSVDAAGYGDTRIVTCAHGRVPESNQVVCGEDGQFHPSPMCKGFYDATDLALTMEASHSARCCCDSEPDGLAAWFSSDGEGHTDRCHLHPGIEHCKDIEAQTRWVHYSRTAHGRCQLDRPTFYQLPH